MAEIVGWFSLKGGAHIPIMKGQSRAEAAKKYYASKHGKTVAKLSSKSKTEKKNITKDINNKEYAKQLGDNLYAINKYAKEFRDARWAEEDFWYRSSLDKEERAKIDEITAKALGFKNAQVMAKAPEVDKRVIISKLKNKEQELYDIKEKVLKKAIDQGAEVKGYHMFYNGRDWNRMEYMEIGEKGFHFDADRIYVTSANLKNLGDIEGTISSKAAKNFSISDYKKAIDFCEDYIK